MADPTKETTEGTHFALGFLRNVEDGFDADLYLSSSHPDGAMATVSFPNRQVPGFPMDVEVPSSGSIRVALPTEGDDDITVGQARDTISGIRVTSDNPIGIIGANEQLVSTDAFLAFPCKDFLPADGSSNTREYKYFVFSTLTEETVPPFNSRFLIVACEAVDNVEIVLPSETEPDSFDLAAYETHLVDQGAGVDLTGTVITSSSPLAVFASHECGQIPSTRTACDHLVEQIPPHVVYGQMFFAIPFAARESGDIFRVGSILDDNVVTVTCNQRSADGSSERVTMSDTITADGDRYYEFRTRRRLATQNLDRDDYRRDFCCIETSKPAIVMQYSLGHTEDEVPIPAGQLGDPAMTLVPPVEQYINSFKINTFNDLRSTGDQFFSYVSWAVSSEFFNPSIINDDRSFQVNGQPFLPASRTNDVLTSRGSEDYVEIYCSNGQICGYGAFSPLTQPGDNLIEWVSTREENPAIYSSIYGFSREVSYAYPAGYQCEPIGREFLKISGRGMGCGYKFLSPPTFVCFHFSSPHQHL